MSTRPEAIIYTDGSCLGNPGPGGWSCIILCDGRETVLTGGDALTTNNRMELIGAINALEGLRGPHIVTLHTDSQYIVNAFNQHWIENWKHYGWSRKDGELKNADLWKRLDKAVQRHTCTFVWVRGHAGNAYNERCDRLAVEESNKWKAQADGHNSCEQITMEPTITQTEACPNRAMHALDNLLRRLNEHETGVEFPCGGRLFCKYCEGGSESKLLCANAYIEYLDRENH